MARLLKLYLLLSSICLFLVSCSISKYKHFNYDKIDVTKDVVAPVLKSKTVSKYNTSIDILKNHLTGLLVVKQIDSVTTRIVFVTELGMKMFDFEAKNHEMNVIYVFEPLNKPQLIEALKRNFTNILLLETYKEGDLKFETISENIFISYRKNKEKNCYTISKANGLILQETFHKHKRTSKITYVYDKNSQTYTNIKCKQYGLIKFYFELNEIQKTND